MKLSLKKLLTGLNSNSSPESLTPILDFESPTAVATETAVPVRLTCREILKLLTEEQRAELPTDGVFRIEVEYCGVLEPRIISIRDGLAVELSMPEPTDAAPVPGVTL